MNNCPKCKTTRRAGLKHCHGCQFEFDEVHPGNERLINSFSDGALGIALLLASLSAVLHVTLAGVSFLSALSGSSSLIPEEPLTALVIAFVSYVIAIVLWRVLNLPK